VRGEFEGGVCDGHSHPIGSEAPEILPPVCPVPGAVSGRYVLCGTRAGESHHGLPLTNDSRRYRWETTRESLTTTASE
jgi:hypothetical protein